MTIPSTKVKVCTESVRFLATDTGFGVACEARFSIITVFMRPVLFSWHLLRDIARNLVTRALSLITIHSSTFVMFATISQIGR